MNHFLTRRRLIRRCIYVKLVIYGSMMNASRLANGLIGLTPLPRNKPAAISGSNSPSHNDFLAINKAKKPVKQTMSNVKILDQGPRQPHRAILVALIALVVNCCFSELNSWKSIQSRKRYSVTANIGECHSVTLRLIANSWWRNSLTTVPITICSHYDNSLTNETATVTALVINIQ